VLLVKLSISTWNLWRTDERLKQEQERVEEVKKKNVELKIELAEVESEEFVEKIAREKLGMGREGEVVVILPEVDYKKIKRQKRKLANWEKWVRVLFY